MGERCSPPFEGGEVRGLETHLDRSGRELLSVVGYEPPGFFVAGLPLSLRSLGRDGGKGFCSLLCCGGGAGWWGRPSLGFGLARDGGLLLLEGLVQPALGVLLVGEGVVVAAEEGEVG